MAKEHPQALAERLFATFLAPLVLGGEMLPGRPIGGKGALSLGEGRPPTDSDLLARTELTRVRIARRLAPLDLLAGAPTGAEWALAAMLHDLVQATHPGFDAALRRSGPKRLLDVVERTLERVPDVASIGDALSRHTWFGRMFELTRTDVDVRWWTGSERFLGAEPPARLLAWPEVRRVTQTRTGRPLMDLPTSGAAVDAHRFGWVVEAFLKKTPLTDLATANRTLPAFAWSRENLALVATRAGRTLTGRALALLPPREVDAALGRATKQLFAAKALRAISVAIELLRERALAAASARLGQEDPEPLALDGGSDGAFALGAGALAAAHWIAETGGGFAAGERKTLLAILGPAAGSPAAGEVKALLGA